MSEGIDLRLVAVLTDEGIVVLNAPVIEEPQTPSGEPVSPLAIRASRMIVPSTSHVSLVALKPKLP